MKRPFLFLLQEILRVVLELDGRAYRTVFYLFTRPGYLTREYFAGRRAQYTPPLRLFLIISITFFLLVSMMTYLRTMQQNFLEQSEAESTEEFLDDSPNVQLSTGDGTDDETPEESLQDLLDVVGALSFPLVSEQTNQNLQTFVFSQARANFEEISENPEEFLIGSLEYITFFMLLMMPILALIQKILLFMCRRYYIEHLVLTLHNHTFLIFAMFVTIVLGQIADLEIPVLSALLEFINVGLVIWMFVYLYLSLKNYFERGYLFSAAIYVSTTVIYSFALSIGIGAFAILLFIFS